MIELFITKAAMWLRVIGVGLWLVGGGVIGYVAFNPTALDGMRDVLADPRRPDLDISYLAKALFGFWRRRFNDGRASFVSCIRCRVCLVARPGFCHAELVWHENRGNCEDRENGD